MKKTILGLLVFLSILLGFSKTGYPDTESITPLQLNFFTPSSIPWQIDNVYGIRANIMYGKNKNVYGIDVGMFNSVQRNFAGIQFGTLCNAMGSRFSSGCSISGFVNYASEGRIYGFYVAGITNILEDACGVFISGALNFTNRKTYGLQISGCGNYSRRLVGAQISLGLSGILIPYLFASIFESPSNSIAASALLMVIASMTNYVKTHFKGLQIGFINITNYGTGFQIGFLNYAKHLKGFQLGVFNIITSSPVPFFPILNVGVSF